MLYLRDVGGPVFTPVSDPAAREKAREQSEQLFEQDVRRVAAGGRVVGVLVDGVTSEAVTVEQKVAEDVEGLVVGAVAVKDRGGRLRVVQKVDTVGDGGTLIGGVISDRDPLELLSDELQAPKPAES